ncbi:hypothetical protein CDAR_182321 [Caerostris darwini]|uniref:Uncharacterized protein n=1 Tax=Caerostris darwini TaxID=1538125 RepID=A0AAV4U5E6_9ARAC|nr:hypothetical protein CDAR_182321 [Caerostris darwini]
MNPFVLEKSFMSSSTFIVSGFVERDLSQTAPSNQCDRNALTSKGPHESCSRSLMDIHKVSPWTRQFGRNAGLECLCSIVFQRTQEFQILEKKR